MIRTASAFVDSNPPPTCPALLIAAPASGQGKTTVTAALARLLTRRGKRVRVFKCGPDFLDPYWHTLAAGAPVYQLDLWMTGEADCRARLAAAAQSADVILIEGVMGLFDGKPSAADLAQHFGVPVLAVVDASAMAGTFGALAFGLQHYRSGLPWAGVLANRVASERHALMLQEALQGDAQEDAATPVQHTQSTSAGGWLGALPRSAAFSLPERHLGLTVATELPDALARLDAAADALAPTPLGQLDDAAWQRWQVTFSTPKGANQVPDRVTPNPDAPLLEGRTIAIARDAAFCFIYAANLDCLESMGARLVFFSPLSDTALPDCDAVWLPGGYPELHAERIAHNTSMQRSVQAHVAAGKPVWAECGGMMALFDELSTADGVGHAMWGILPGRVTMQKRLAALGPQQLEWAGETLRGHTFHYSTSSTTLTPIARTARPGQPPAVDQGEAVWQQGAVRASYFHAWFASSPRATAALFAKET